MKTPMLATALIVALGCSGPALAKNDKEKPLPPGLHKKESRGQALPPGWQQKLKAGSTLDMDVYEQSEVVARDPGKGTMTIRLEGKLIKIIQNSHEIVDILDSL